MTIMFGAIDTAPTTETIDAWTERLLADGYAIIPGLAAPDSLAGFCDDLDRVFRSAPFGRGAFYGETTKRFGRLAARSRHAEALICHPLILGIVRNILCQDGRGIQLNLSQAIEIHPDSPVQVPHRDQEMWGKPPENEERMINVMWALDPFTAENGATRIWPKSNHAAPDSMLPDDEAIPAEAPRGSAILFLGSTLHSGGENMSDKPRRGAIFSYCRDYLLPDENPWLSYPPEIARGFSPELREIVGYRQRFAGLNNFEGQSPAVLIDAADADTYAFTDDMSEDQLCRIAAYYAEREAAKAARSLAA